MSGGHFDYIQYRMEEIADSIRNLIRDNKTKNEFGYANDFPKDILEKFKSTADLVSKAAKRVHRIDYLVEGDDSFESFRKRWAEEKLDD